MKDKKILILVLIVIIGIVALLLNNKVKQNNEEIKKKNQNNNITISNNIDIRIIKMDLINENILVNTNYVDLNLYNKKIELYKSESNIDNSSDSEEENISNYKSNDKKIKDINLDNNELKKIDDLITDIINNYDKYNVLGNVVYSTINENVLNENYRMLENYNNDKNNYYTTNYYKVFEKLEVDEFGNIGLNEIGTIYLEENLKLIDLLFR